MTLSMKCRCSRMHSTHWIEYFATARVAIMFRRELLAVLSNPFTRSIRTHVPPRFGSINWESTCAA